MNVSLGLLCVFVQGFALDFFRYKESSILSELASIFVQGLLLSLWIEESHESFAVDPDRENLALVRNPEESDFLAILIVNRFVMAHSITAPGTATRPMLEVRRSPAPRAASFPSFRHSINLLKLLNRPALGLHHGR